MKIYHLQISTVLLLFLLSLLSIEVPRDHHVSPQYYSGYHFNIQEGASQPDEKELLPEKQRIPEIAVLPVKNNPRLTIPDYSSSREVGHTSMVEQVAFAESGFEIRLGKAGLTGAPGSVKKETRLLIQGLNTHEIPPLDAGMVNVTGYHSGYEMLPHGMLFEQDIQILLPYDRSLLPVGYVEEDIRTYYYDEQFKKWMVLERDSIDWSNELVISRVNHFTDFINAIIKVPEMPETQAYTPTTMSGIQAANPLTELSLMQPPSPNNNGTVNLSYPIDIPAGRQGMQPNLAVSYSSDGGNGWLGLGWNLTISMITVETRWGVPHYDLEKESEGYLLNGEQLISKNGEGYNPLPHRAEWIDRMQGDIEFCQRVEGSFQKIVRHGTSPRNYWWEVTDKNGVRYFYGKKLGTNALDPNAVLTDHLGNIAKWGLTEVRDLYDNFVYYTYNVSTANEERWIYPKEITYTGYGTSTLGKYRIAFVGKMNYTPTSNGRFGFKEVDRYLLNDIKISYNNEVFKQYRFCYETGAFSKNLLKRIAELEPECFNSTASNCGCDVGNNSIKTHAFEYYTAPANMFGNPVTISTGSDPGANGLVAPGLTRQVTALGGSSTVGWNVGGGATAGIGLPFNKSLTGGGNYMYSQSDMEGVITLIDMDGDGLPDKVFRNRNGELRYRKQQLVNGVYSFSAPVTLTGLRENLFLKETSSSNDWGWEAHIVGGITRSGNTSKTKSSTTVYISDVNADGLPDIVQDGYVYFNHLVNGVPTFQLTSPESIQSEGGFCPDLGMGSVDGENPGGGPGTGQISVGEPITREIFRPGRMVVTPFIYKDQVRYDTTYVPEEREFYPTHDLVKMWIAPYSGTISINAPVTLTENLMELRRFNEVTDGLQVSIQKGNNIIYTAHLNPHPDSTSYNISLGSMNVSRGERIYFRLESLKQRKYDKIHWTPEITYHSATGGSPSNTATDADGKKIYVFNASKDFLINPKRKYYMPFEGQVKIESVLDILHPLSSAVKFKAYKNGTEITAISNYPPQQGIVSNVVLNSGNISVNQGDSIWIEVVSNTNVDWQAIKWKTDLFYVSTTENVEVNNGDYGQSRPNIIYEMIPYFTYYPKPVLPTRTYTYTSNTTISSLRVYLAGASGTAPYTLSIKNANGVVLEHTANLSNGNNTVNLPASITLSAGQTYYFDLYCRNNVVASNITTAYYNINNYVRYSGVHTMQKEGDAIFGDLYRNWGQFNYLNETGQYTTPINQNLLQLSENFREATENPEVFANHPYEEEVFLMMDPDYYYNRWIGYGNISYVTADTLSNTYPSVIRNNFTATSHSFMGNGLEHSPLPSYPIGDVGPMAVIKMSESVNKAKSRGNGALFGSAGTTENNGEVTIKTDYMDMNGDGYPDVITEYDINYSQPQGGLSSLVKGHYLRNNFQPNTGREYKSEFSKYSGTGSNFGASFSSAKKESTTKKGQSQIIPTGNAGAGTGENDSKGICTWIDINGDGLPDKVADDGTYHLNLGYMFRSEMKSIYTIKADHSDSYGVNIGGSFNLGGTSFSGGLSSNGSTNNSTVVFMDINGDGLPDRLEAYNNTIRVYYNIAEGDFSAPVTLLTNARIFSSESYSGGINGAISFGFTIPVWFVLLKFMVNPKGGGSWGINKTLTQFIDMDGDGLPDYVTANGDDQISVRYNQTGKTNLLKSVTNIAKGQFQVDYKLSENSYECPSRMWTMSSLNIFDGHSGDGSNNQYYTFEYKNPRYQRYEKTSLGFEEVVTKQRSTASVTSTTNIYRVTTEKYHNEDFIRKGLKYYELLTNYSTNAANIKKYVEKFYNYALHNLNTGQVIDEDDFCSGIGYPALREEIVKYYEAQTSPLIITRKLYEYGRYGNIVAYTNFGDNADFGDDLISKIEYHPDTYNKYVVGVPQVITVRDYNGNILRHRKCELNNKGKVATLSINNIANTSRFSVYNYTYDTRGNVSKVTLPENHAGQRLVYYYYYDTQVYAYPVRVRKYPFEDNSYSTYDYKWGKPLTTTDINNNVITYTYDWRGRLSSVKGPYESDYTMKFYYWLDRGVNHLPSVGSSVRAWAVTYHYDSFQNTNPMTTTLFCDALGRVIQTKKDIEINGTEYSSVSGRANYDTYGRVTSQYYPVTETIPANSQNPDQRPQPTFNTALDNVNPTMYTYDVLDRQTRVTLPDGSVTQMTYGFGHDGSYYRFYTTTIDANNKRVYTYTDLRGLQIRVRTSVGSSAVNTYFKYNAMGELLESIDPDGLKTTYAYNLLGLCTERRHPDAGFDIYTYDPAGNLYEHRTTNLLSEVSANYYIGYKYNYDRLTEIRYPKNPINNVYYTYGNDATQNNRARVIQIEDGSGWQQFVYGALGEVLEHHKTFVLPNEDDAFTFKMKFKYDTWNRIKQMTYPDGENVLYFYDKGGNLKNNVGVKFETNLASTFYYVNNITYDKFGKKTSITYGNGTSSQYAYDNLQRLSNLKSYDDGGNLLQDVNYAYDGVSNILNVENTALNFPYNMGGAYTNSFTYDDLYRLTSSSHSIDVSNPVSSPAPDIRTATTNMEYKLNGRLVKKTNNISSNRIIQGYGEYRYPENKNTPTRLVPAGMLVRETYTDLIWDYNGNMTDMKVYSAGRLLVERKLYWEEMNRVMAVGDNFYNSYYAYDAAGERTYKFTGDRQQIYVNGVLTYFDNLNTPTLYTSPYLVATPQGYTKHIYAGTERVVSKIGGGKLTDLRNHNFTAQQISAKKAPQLSRLNQIFQREIGRTCTIANNALENLRWFVGQYQLEKDLYYYHTDHLGSTSWITDKDGKPVQYMNYLPFGETFVDQRSGNWNTPYTFSGKEKDAETGYHYFGARYYDSNMGIWLSVDPMASKYPSLSPYVYCANNPIILIDPDGRDIDGVTYDKKTQKFSYSEAALSRGTDKYIQSRMSTESGAKGVMKMVNSKETFTLHVTDKAMFVNDKVDGKDGYTKIGGIAENNNIYISTYDFDNQSGENDYNNAILINDGGSSTIMNIDPNNVFSGTGNRNDEYDKAFRDSGLEKFVNTPGNEYKSQEQYIHGMGAHEERHLFQHPSLNSIYKRETDAMRHEIYERKQFINQYK